MCIICNMGDDFASVENASTFLTKFSQAAATMKQAAEALHKCVSVDRKYDATHKSMVRLIAEWNGLEHSREHVVPTVHGRGS